MFNSWKQKLMVLGVGPRRLDLGDDLVAKMFVVQAQGPRFKGKAGLGSQC